jgi:hypothetical protein
VGLFEVGFERTEGYFLPSFRKASLILSNSGSHSGRFSSPPQKGGGDGHNLFSSLPWGKFLDRAFRKFTLIVLEWIFDSQIAGSGNFYHSAKIVFAAGQAGIPLNRGLLDSCLSLKVRSDCGCSRLRIFFILTSVLNMPFLRRFC